MISRCKPLLGTFVEIKVFEEDKSYNSVINKAFERMEEVHNMMSFFDSDSEVSLLNKGAHIKEVKVSAELFFVLSLAKEIFEVSNGIFDVTLHRSDAGSSFGDVNLNDENIVKFAKPLKIDLGGIAKGYAVDCAAEVLEKNGVFSYIINAGGDIRVGSLTQKISIRNPKNPSTLICEAEICEGSLATSAGYFSKYEVEGKSVFPIFDPKTGASRYEEESASVFAKTCATADALTKVVTILKSESDKILSHFESSAMVVNSQSKVLFINNL